MLHYLGVITRDFGVGSDISGFRSDSRSFRLSESESGLKIFSESEVGVGVSQNRSRISGSELFIFSESESVSDNGALQQTTASFCIYCYFGFIPFSKHYFSI